MKLAIFFKVLENQCFFMLDFILFKTSTISTVINVLKKDLFLNLNENQVSCKENVSVFGCSLIIKNWQQWVSSTPK